MLYLFAEAITSDGTVTARTLLVVIATWDAVCLAPQPRFTAMQRFMRHVTLLGCTLLHGLC